MGSDPGKLLLSWGIIDSFESCRTILDSRWQKTFRQRFELEHIGNK
jgi:hypothetical protein